ncbi:MAG: OsmC family protein [Chloroflexi bacterium]|nr:OsmC family protein [Chloroflexota bacterium]
MPPELNGWDVGTMTEAVEGVRQQPEAGKLTWRSRVIWDGGFGLDVRTREIEQLGQVIDRRFTLRGDHPPELLGHNTGPTAVETLLAALGSCMAGTFAAQATARGVRLDALEVDVEGTIDLNGFFGLKPIRPGLSDVRLSYRVKSDAEQQTLQEILDAAKSLSPVFDSVTKPVAVEATVRKA